MWIMSQILWRREECWMETGHAGPRLSGNIEYTGGITGSSEVHRAMKSWSWLTTQQMIVIPDCAWYGSYVRSRLRPMTLVRVIKVVSCQHWSGSGSWVWPVVMGTGYNLLLLTRELTRDSLCTRPGLLHSYLLLSPVLASLSIIPCNPGPALARAR